MLKSRFIKLLGAITIINIIARLFGFGREVFIGYQYGTTYHADSIIAAFTVPNFLYLVLGGAVTTAFISVYSKLDSTAKQHFFQTIFSWLSLIVGSITILFMLFPNFWVELFFNGMSKDAIQLTSHLYQWTAPATLFLVIGILLSGLHNSHGHYQVSTFSTFIFNGVYFVIGVGLTPWLMEYSYALGATIGSVFMVVMLIHYVRRYRLVPFHFQLTYTPDLKRFIKLALPLLFGGATMQFYLVIQRIFAADLNGGAIAAVNYAAKMTQFPQAVLMTSVTTIIYPILAKAAGENDFTRLNGAYRKGFRMLTIILIPASIFIFFYAKDIIAFIFEYGQFSAESTDMTYPLLQLFAIGIIGFGLNMYITRFFYALENTFLPVALNIITIFGVNIIIIILLMDTLGAKAIALGTVVSALLNMVVLIYFAKRKLNLTICTLHVAWKLIGYSLFAGFIIFMTIFIPTTLTFVTLLIGGCISGILILGGLRFVK